MAISKKASLTFSQPSDSASSFMEEANIHLELPETPSIRIRASNKWSSINLQEIWAHRELLYFLVWRDLKVRYKQTILGVSWVILQPVLMTLIFAVFLGNIAHIPSDGVPYILFLYSGLLPWTFFSNAVSTSSHSLIASAHMITKVYFPRAIVPLAAILVRLSDFLVASAILVGLMIYYGQPITRSILIAPFLILHLTLLALALSLWFAALNVKYRDVGTVLPVILQLWMFASPIIYPASLVAPRWKWAYSLNPLVGIVGGFRAALLGSALDRKSLLFSAVITVMLLVYSTFVFRRMEDQFADVV
jgi:lipopolysaccharide transport system permease protein